MVKNMPASAGATRVVGSFAGLEMAICYNILAWKVP